MRKAVYKKTTLDNGIRIITEKVNLVRSVTLGVWIDAGSRQEEENEQGVAHFIEHMLFKGTKKRTAKEIASTLESVGGTLNAFTEREQTCYYARVLDENLNIAIDVLSDILKNSLLSGIDFKKEKKVIIEEIKDIEDSPGILVHDLFMEALWPKHPLGRPTLGTIKSIIKMKKERICDYMKRNYVYPHVVIAASGNLDHNKLVKLIEKNFEFFPFTNNYKNQAAGTPEAVKLIAKRKSAQTHICLGVPCYAFGNEKRYPLSLLSHILGGGMSSRLFQSIRENLGLAYNIYSFTDYFKDSGIFGVYLGTNKKQAAQAIDLVVKELTKIAKNHLSDKEISDAKRYYKGSLILSSESTSTRMNRLARNELYLNEYIDWNQTIQRIKEIKKEQIIEVATEVLNPDKFSLVVLGPAAFNTLEKINI
jgi:predicted Zn-dependent peptidase